MSPNASNWLPDASKAVPRHGANEIELRARPIPLGPISHTVEPNAVLEEALSQGVPR